MFILIFVHFDNRERTFRTVFQQYMKLSFTSVLLENCVLPSENAKRRLHLARLKENASISSAGRKVHATRGTIWSVKSVTRKNTRAGFPKIGKYRGEFVGEISSRLIFPVTSSGSIPFNSIDCRKTIFHVYETRNYTEQTFNNMFNICLTLVYLFAFLLKRKKN